MHQLLLTHTFTTLLIILFTSLSISLPLKAQENKASSENISGTALHHHDEDHDHDHDEDLGLKNHGSFVIGIGHDGKKEFMDGRVTLENLTSNRFRVLVELDVRPFLVKGEVKKELLENEELRMGIHHAIAMQIAMQKNIPLSSVTVPEALVDAALENFVNDHISNKAVTEATIRQIYFEAAITGTNSGEGLSILVGKVNPIWSLDHGYHNHGVHSHYYFGISQPTIRTKLNIGKGTVIYAQVSNDRHGAIEDPHGSDTTGFVTNLLARSDAELLSYKINSFEVGIVKPIFDGEGGVTVISAGRRPKRDDNVRGLSTSDNYYIVMNYSTHTKWLDIQTQGSLEGVGLSQDQKIERLNVMLTKSLFNDRLIAGAQVFVKKYTATQANMDSDMQMGQPTQAKAKLVSWMTGLNYIMWHSGKKSLALSGNFGRVKMTGMTHKHTEVGVGFRW